MFVSSNTFARLRKSEFFRGFTATLMGSGMSRIILTISTFVFVNIMSKMEFGEFSFVRNTLNTILCICALNFSSLCTKFTVEAEENVSALKRLMLLFVFSLSVCFVIGFTLVVLPTKILTYAVGSEKIVFSFRIIGLLLPLFVMQPLIEGMLRGFMKFKLIGIIQTCTSLLFVFFVVIGYLIYSLQGALFGIISYYSVYALINTLFLVKLSPYENVKDCLYTLGAEKKVLWDMIIPIFLMSFYEAPIMWIAQVILAKYDSMEAVGGMTAILQIRSLIIIVPSYLFGTFVAFAGKMNSEKRYKEYFDKFNKLGVMLLAFGIFLSIVCSLFSKQILAIYGKDFISDYIPMIISNICIPLFLIVSLLKIDLVIQEHQKILLYTSLIWNTLWLILLFAFLQFKIIPLVSFFSSQLIALCVYTFMIGLVYLKDRNILLKI